MTEETRDFTIWYSIALNNPPQHTYQQPFFNIKCNRDPENELCIEADYIDCPDNTNDTLDCTVVGHVDAIDWACHRFKIPEEFIDSIAILEITAADCGLGAHFGYAYIDGICEDCTGSSLGSINIDSTIVYDYCYEEIAIVCGSYTLPSVCETWSVDEIRIPGYTIQNLSINTNTQTFCFEFPISNFSSEDCLDVYAEIDFTSSTFDLPTQLSNDVEICKSLYEQVKYTVSRSDCYPNGTDDFLSDDYYYVTLELENSQGQYWYINRKLDDPYPDESGVYTLADGYGDQSIELGPFYIQEGDWELQLLIDNCVFYEDIVAGDFCSDGCSEFSDMEMSNVQCNSNNTWSFDIIVSGPIGKKYSIKEENSLLSELADFNSPKTIIFPIPPNSICYNLELKYDDGSSGGCVSNITVCPPKPCSGIEDCDLEVYVIEIDCTKDEITEEVDFDVTIDVSGYSSYGSLKTLCYAITEPTGITTGKLILSQGQATLIGFSSDITITVFLCDNNDCLTNCGEVCFKTIFIPLPDCEGRSRQNMPMDVNEVNFGLHDVNILPNPVMQNEFTIYSNFETTEFEIYDNTGKFLKDGNFNQKEYKLTMELVPGIYILRYRKKFSKWHTLKFIRI